MAVKKTVEKKVLGRPTTFDIEIAKKVCHEIATTPLSVQEICNKFEEFPSCPTFYFWMQKSPELLKFYAAAKEEQAEILVDDMLTVARSKSEDTISATDKKLLLDVLKWNAARRQPKKFGDRVVIEDGKGAEEVIKASKAKLDKTVLKKKRGS